MVVSLLLKLVQDFELCTNGVKIQFVTHSKGLYGDKIYDGCILATPYDRNGNLNRMASKYYHQVNFKNADNRDAFRSLVLHYHMRNCDKRLYVPFMIDLCSYHTYC